MRRRPILTEIDRWLFNPKILPATRWFGTQEQPVAISAVGFSWNCKGAAIESSVALLESFRNARVVFAPVSATRGWREGHVIQPHYFTGIAKPFDTN